MEYAELAAGLYMLISMAYVSAKDDLSKLLFKAPPPAFGAVLVADALSRAGWI